MKCEDCGKPLTLATVSVEHSDLCVLCARLYDIEFDAWWEGLTAEEQADFDRPGGGLQSLIDDLNQWGDLDEIED